MSSTSCTSTWTILPFSLFSRQNTPFVTTLHGRLDLPELKPIFKAFPDVPVVSISNEQRRPLPSCTLRWHRCAWAAGAVAHAAESDRSAYLAFLGRITAEKGPDRAGLWRAAQDRGEGRRCGPVLLRLRHSSDAGGRGGEMVGEISDIEKPAFLSGAIALLMPIVWPEPFGLVMIEAIACGTPVIAFNRGGSARSYRKWPNGLHCRG